MKQTWTHILLLALLSGYISGCVGGNTNGNRGVGRVQGANTLNAPPRAFKSGRHFLALLKSNGQSKDLAEYPALGNGQNTGVHPGNQTDQIHKGNQVTNTNQANSQTNQRIGRSLQSNQRYSPLSDGLHMFRVGLNARNGVYQDKNGYPLQSIPMPVEADSQVITSMDGTAYMVSSKAEGLVRVGYWDSRQGVLQAFPDNYGLTYKSPTILRSTYSKTLGETIAVVHSDGSYVSIVAVVKDPQGKPVFRRDLYTFKPSSGSTSVVKDLQFSPGGEYIYFATHNAAHNTAAGGQLIVCHLETMIRKRQSAAGAAAESIAYGSGCVPGNPSAFNGQANPTREQNPFPVSVGTQDLRNFSFPEGLFVTTGVVGVWNLNNIAILIPPKTGEHAYELNTRLEITAPTVVARYEPAPLSTRDQSRRLAYHKAFPHPKNNNLVAVVQDVSNKEMFVKVLSTEHLVSLGDQFESIPLDNTVVTSVMTDVGALHEDGTPTYDGNFLLVAQNSGLIRVMTYFGDNKGIVYNNQSFDTIPVRGFDVVSMAVRTSTPAKSPSVDLQDIISEDNGENKGD